MAIGQRRMVYTNVFSNPEFCKLSDRAKLLYIGLVVHADDDGRLRANSLLLRSQVFPVDKNMQEKDVRKLLNEVVKLKLVEFYCVDGEYFIQHPNWKKYQTIRKDLYKPSNFPRNPLRKSNEDDTEKLPNISKDNINKEREARPQSSINYLKNIPQTDLFEFMQRFDCSKKALISKGEDLLNYCNSKGKTYKDYKSLMLNALKKDFPERRADDPLKTSVLREVDGVMKVVPKELQDAVVDLTNKFSVEKDLQ